MPLQNYVTGAVACFMAARGDDGSAESPSLLGYGEEAPDMAVENKKTGVRCDLTGYQIPKDFAWDGAVGIVSVVLTYWDENIATRLCQFPGPQRAGITTVPGRWRQSDYGTLLATENRSFLLWLRYLYGSGSTEKTVYTTPGPTVPGGLDGGFRFLQCHFAGPWSITAGARPMKRQFLFEAWPFGPDITLNPQNPTYRLYDNIMDAVVNLPFV